MEQGMKYLAAITAVLVLCLAASVEAQAADTLSVTAKPGVVRVKAGKQAKVTLVLSIKRGFHVNSNRPQDKSLLPTRVALSPRAGFTLNRVAYPTPRRRKFSFTDKPIDVFEGRVNVVMSIGVAKRVKPGPHPLKVKVTYQACDDEACLMPEEASASVTIKVTR